MFRRADDAGAVADAEEPLPDQLRRNVLPKAHVDAVRDGQALPGLLQQGAVHREGELILDQLPRHNLLFIVVRADSEERVVHPPRHPGVAVNAEVGHLLQPRGALLVHRQVAVDIQLSAVPADKGPVQLGVVPHIGAAVGKNGDLRPLAEERDGGLRQALRHQQLPGDEPDVFLRQLLKVDVSRQGHHPAAGKVPRIFPRPEKEGAVQHHGTLEADAVVGIGLDLTVDLGRGQQAAEALRAEDFPVDLDAHVSLQGRSRAGGDVQHAVDDQVGGSAGRGNTGTQLLPSIDLGDLHVPGNIQGICNVQLHRVLVEQLLAVLVRQQDRGIDRDLVVGSQGALPHLTGVAQDGVDRKGFVLFLVLHGSFLLRHSCVSVG